jgi:hypothetical protein
MFNSISDLYLLNASTLISEYFHPYQYQYLLEKNVTLIEKYSSG